MILFLVGLLCAKINDNMDPIESYIKAVIHWHVFILSSVYLLSITHLLTIQGVLATLILSNLLIWGYNFCNKKLILPISCKIQFKNIFLFAIPFIFFLIAFYFAYITVPYNWDSMTYHLPRLAHWSQNHSVLHYATHNDRQVGSTTLASYICLYVYILSGKRDIFLNLIQCIAYGTNALIIYGIARSCNVNKINSMGASILYLTMPIAFAEATTTQNDNFATMWLLFFIYMAIPFTKIENKFTSDRVVIKRIIYLGVCLAMGYLSKPSICFAILICLLWILWKSLKRKDSIWICLKLSCIGLLSCIPFLIPQWIQNIITYGKLSPNNVGRRQLVGTLQINFLFINFIKNFVYNLGNSLITNSKAWLSKSLYVLSELCRVPLDDPQISEDGEKFSFSSFQYGCDTALNPFVLLLSITVIVWCIIRWKKQDKISREYCFFAMLSFMTLCVFLRWEPFISRYMTGYFALLCPMIVIQLQDIISLIKKVWAKILLYTLLIVTCSINYFFVIKNVNSIETKDYPDSYFFHVGWYTNDYENICDIIVKRGYHNIGIIMGSNSYEYPLWGILSPRIKDLNIKHIMVDGVLSKYEDKFFDPDCIFVLDCEKSDRLVYNGNVYTPIEIQVDNDIYLYSRVKENVE